MPGIWFGAPFDPAAIAKCKGKRRRDDLLAIANTRLGIVLERPLAVERMRCEPTTILAERPSRRRSVAVRWREVRVKAAEAQCFNGAELVQSQRRRVGRKPKEESQAVAVTNGEWHKRAAMVRLASVAQQSVAPEPPKRDSYGYW